MLFLLEWYVQDAKKNLHRVGFSVLELVLRVERFNAGCTCSFISSHFKITRLVTSLGSSVNDVTHVCRILTLSLLSPFSKFCLNIVVRKIFTPPLSPYSSSE